MGLRLNSVLKSFRRFNFYSALPLVLCLPFQAQSQSVDIEKIKVDPSKPLRIEYFSPGLNKSSQEEDIAALLVRDSLTKKSVKVEMRESGPNTGLFSGSFVLRFGSEGSESLAPEIYLVPASMAEDFKSLESLIADGVLLNKPYFFQPHKNLQRATLFETREQALEAMDKVVNAEAYQESAARAALEAQQKAEEARRLSLEAKRLAELEAERARLAKLAADQAAERARMELEERRKREERIRQEAQLAEAERARRRAEAKKLAEQALVHYNNRAYDLAEKKFQQSIELDPENTKYNFQYGVSLYRTDKFNLAAVILESAKGEAVNEQERDYFLGLTFMKLKESKQAKPKFAKAKGGQDKVISSSSAFYMGVIDYQNEEFETAKTEFEFVLDNSDDPRLDEQADLYLDQIANALQFKKMLARRWSGSLNFGLMYDSNILNQADSNSSTGLYGYRGVYGGSLEYRAIFSANHEFIPALSFSDLYTVTSSFKPEAAYQNTDPLQFSFALPYKYKGVVFGKPGQAGLKATYETLRLNADTSGSRETISHSYVLRSDLALVASESVIGTYFIEARNDVSTIEVSAPNLRQSAMKVSIGTNRTYFQDSKKSKAWIYDGALSNNAALGDELKYQKLDLGAMYLFPGWFEGTWTAKLGLAHTKYNSHSASRADNTGTLTLGMTKPITNSLMGIFNLGYTRNSSNITTNAYNKITLLTMLSWNGVL